MAPAPALTRTSRVSCSGIVTGIYTTSSPEACQYIAQDSRANIIVLDTQKQLEKILKVWGAGEAGTGARGQVSLWTSSLQRTFPPFLLGSPSPFTATPRHTDTQRTRQGNGYLPLGSSGP